MVKVKFLPANIEAECASNENLFKLANRVGVKVPTSCGGVGACSRCKIKIVAGEEYLNEPTKAEKVHLGNVYWLTKTRLCCQVKGIKDGNVIVEVKND